jgi:negative regulator of sigma E activity
MNSDEELAAMLRAHDEANGDARVDADRMAALHRRIMLDAAATLARFRRQRTVWDYSAQWARAAVPLALAASILAAVVLVRAPVAGQTATVAAASADSAVSPHDVMHRVAAGQLGSAEMLDSLVGPVTRDAMYSRLLRGAQ